MSRSGASGHVALDIVLGCWCDVKTGMTEMLLHRGGRNLLTQERKPSCRQAPFILNLPDVRYPDNFSILGMELFPSAACLLRSNMQCFPRGCRSFSKQGRDASGDTSGNAKDCLSKLRATSRPYQAQGRLTDFITIASLSTTENEFLNGRSM